MKSGNEFVILRCLVNASKHEPGKEFQECVRDWRRFKAMHWKVQ